MTVVAFQPRKYKTKKLKIMELEKLINWGELSRILVGSRSVVTRKRMPKKHVKDVNDLLSNIEKWYKQLKK
jgi:hypothetical protein